MVEEVALAKAKLLHRFEHKDLDWSHLRFLAVTELSCSGCKTDSNSRDLLAQPDTLRLFSHEATVWAWHKSSIDSSSMADKTGFINILARVDPFFASVLSCLQDYETEGVGAHWLKDYHKSFFFFPPFGSQSANWMH